MGALYLTEQGSVLHRTGERLVVTKGDRVIADVPATKVDQVVVMGNVQLTTAAMSLLLQADIDVVFLSSYGKFRGRLTATGSRFAELRHLQLQKMSDEKGTLALARQIVTGKLTNQRTVLQRSLDGLKDAGARRQVEQGVSGIGGMLKALERAKSLDAARGYEGKAGAWYFGAFKALLDEEWKFNGRQYHPPPDPINALLSFGYTLLLKDIVAAVQIVGLDPYLGYFHAIDYGRPSLALDIMEEFRPTIVDTLVLHLVNAGTLKPQDFRREKQDRPVLLEESGRRRFIQAYEEKVNTAVIYPPTGERTTYRRCFELQARQFARCIREVKATYRPMTIR
jgi:CRISPR-associated protein Cas1